ncbi:MAG TPA: transglycosylase SLT domain-containing protein [Acidobacteriota bacterium]|nr:transglycosylase SLT domain-containing protein [Acidobacteriota bacterium]
MSLLIGLVFLFVPLGSGEDKQTQSTRLPASLEPFIPAYPAPVDDALKALKRGVEEYVNGDYSSCLNALPDDSSTGKTSVGDFVLLYKAKANLMLERGEEALNTYRQLQSRYPDSPLYPDAVLGECQAELKLHNPGAALAALRNPKLEDTADSYFYQARALEDSGERQQAVDLYLRVYCDYVNSSVADLARDRLLALSPRALSGTQGYRSQLVRADNLLRAGRNREAEAVLVRLGKLSAPDKLSSEKRCLLYADTEYHLGKATVVLPQLRKVTSADPALHARAVYLEAACFRRLKREESFLKTRDKALKLYPKSPYTEQLLAAVASQYDVSNEIEQAQQAYCDLYERFPKGEHAERALWRMSLFHFVQQRYGEALQGFYRYLAAYPNPSSAIPAIYWMARCYQRAGDTSHASVLLERIRSLAHHSYYGKRALEAEQTLKKAGDEADQPLLALDFAEVAAKVNAVRLSLAGISEPPAAVAAVIERARQLAAAGLPDLALLELHGAMRKFPAERALSYVASRIYEIKDDYYGVTATLRRAFPDYNDRPADSLPLEIWQLLFPVKHWDVIAKQAAKYNIDPNLVLGIIRQESSFKEEARSSANARGLMQVLPSTGRRVARQAGVTRYTVKKLYTAETNIILGLQHFSSLLRQYANSEELALAAYNAGDDRSDRWMQEFGVNDMAEFVERIPFSETRGYIKQIMTNQAHYAFLTSGLNGSTR